MQMHEDDGFHEVHLNGKQLVFLFMAATAISVVLFLCGVLVGRGVRAARDLQAGQVVASETAVTETAMPLRDAPPIIDERSDPRVAAPPPAVSDAPDTEPAARPVEPREQPSPTAQVAVPAPPAPVPVVQAPPTPAPAPAPARAAEQPRPAAPPPAPVAPAPPRAASTPERPASSEGESARPATAPRSGEWVVQVAALNVRSEADEIAKRLTTKGYPTYVVTPPNSNQKVFRVRIGPFNSRREADTTAAKLQREEQFKPWVTR
jgi:DedD protein